MEFCIIKCNRRIHECWKENKWRSVVLHFKIAHFTWASCGISLRGDTPIAELSWLDKSFCLSIAFWVTHLSRMTGDWLQTFLVLVLREKDVLNDHLIDELIWQLTTAEASCYQSIQIQISDLSQDGGPGSSSCKELLRHGYITRAEQERRMKLANI